MKLVECVPNFSEGRDLEKVKSIDGSLTGYIKAEENKVLKNLEQIEKRWLSIYSPGSLNMFHFSDSRENPV